ncbi:hypothetical protein AWW73_17725 [Acinetobacter lactucae]|uniref:hypothetical protein n=1 Tax=Acinetobacter calcoaceticus/baumannii complex TaxID=909768 RepID=UPI0007A06D45|nr:MULTISPECIES: hypothetical protein [Acinetobacter calcoaceticus/baumannii complex]KYQ80102.1 hypothetical protein AWW73_17725 [Acinetobacter lactucae]MDC4635135.1 hypothetical protein [Acinetobacter baumannii]MDC5328038.1 hypothetical protein [Acinetobacter baumannii]OIF75264.1 hypothetical protein A7M51_02110 [Acinetobacter baumannii]HDQ4280826.1 hypothetical protein [Acinetobacter baumannii]
MINIQKLEKLLLAYNRRLVKNYNGYSLPPATSIGGIYSNFKHLDYSQRLISPVAPKLTYRLSKLGKIGEKSSLCNNIIGSCCEVHVTNNLLLKHPNPLNLKIDNIKFTRARRPRTNQYIKRCPNCTFIFGNER